MTPALLDPPTLAPPAVRRGSSPLAPPRERPPAAPVGGRFVLHAVDWPTYRRLREAPEHAGYRFTFDGPTGRLEVEVSLGPLHELVSRLLYALVLEFRRHGGPRFLPTGAVTLNRTDLIRGAEADDSFYIAHLDRAPDLTVNTLDLSGGAPPPDLVVEVDVTNPGVDKLPIFAALGVPEVWVWNDAAETLLASRLTAAGAYQIVAESGALPGFPLTVAGELIRNRAGQDAGDLQAAFAAHLNAGGEVFGSTDAG